MKEKFETILRQLISGIEEKGPLTGIEIARQFRPGEKSPQATLRNLNAAFLIALSGQSHPFHSQAERYIDYLGGQSIWKNEVDFYRTGLSLVGVEIEKRCAEDAGFRESLNQLYHWTKNPQNLSSRIETIYKVWEVFFPEGVGLLESRSHNIDSLRMRRIIRITRLNPSPIQDPAREILFTSNVLLTIPTPSMSIDDLAVADELKDRLRQVRNEPQVYWYDHPVQIGLETERNEVIHGLEGLNQAIEFEKRRGVVEKDLRIHCVLSVSVTHAGLHGMAKACLEEMFERTKGINHLYVYALTGADTSRLVQEVLLPAGIHYLGLKDDHLLHEIICVDGKYGRHYSFLKAFSAFWQVFLDPRIKATFKIDLDQVFPQEELVIESGASALEHLKTPLWGAEGIDQDGTKVNLGMIAGALVNQKDIAGCLFTPDVSFSDEDIAGDEWVFLSRLPQALSTEAEMMTRYTDSAFSCQDRCIQRFHVTGGTNGILVESVRRYRPFTPGFIGRAEDQAYLLSVLFQGSKGSLRYVHKDGLIMRHDKEALACEASLSAHTGKLIGDYARILLFSYYARGLPWSVGRIKHAVDPYTGCFISNIPFTVVYLRLALRAAFLYEDGKHKEGFDLLQMGPARLNDIIEDLVKTQNPLRKRYLSEKRAWDVYYDILDKVEEGLNDGDPFALDLKQKAKKLIEGCKMSLGTSLGGCPRMAS